MARVVAIGASQGGVAALRTVAAGLPGDFPAAVLVVLHTGAENSILPSLLSEVGELEATHAKDGEPIRPGHIFIAPPDHHLLVMDGHLELSRGPRENWARPAIDPLFRTAARTYGKDAAGIVLTGGLNDGTSGLLEIKQRGGIALVQDPREAEAPSMPQSALDNVEVDGCLRIRDLAPRLVRLAKEEAGDAESLQPRMGDMSEDQYPSRPAAQTCPECGGAMRRERQGKLIRFRCHIGHVMTAEYLAAAQLQRLEDGISTVWRTLNERVALCREFVESQQGRNSHAEEWRHAAEEAEGRERVLRQLVHAGWSHPENFKEPG